MGNLVIEKKKADINKILSISASLDSAANLVHDAGASSQTIKRLHLGESSDSSDSAGGSSSGCESRRTLRDRKKSTSIRSLKTVGRQ